METVHTKVARVEDVLEGCCSQWQAGEGGSGCVHALAINTQILASPSSITTPPNYLALVPSEAEVAAGYGKGSIGFSSDEPVVPSKATHGVIVVSASRIPPPVLAPGTLRLDGNAVVLDMEGVYASVWRDAQRERRGGGERRMGAPE